MMCTAGALDTDCIDKETCWPLLKSATDLYELTSSSKYLEIAKAAGYYTLSWMFHYNIPYDEESDFEKHGYKTCGGTSVSTQHHHLDPWGALLSFEWMRLYKYTGDKRWAIRARAAWANALQCLSDGNLKIHGMERPPGAQNEAFFHCNWTFEGFDKMGGLNDWLVAWPTAFRLLTIMQRAEVW